MVSRIYRALYLWVIERIGLLKFRGRVLIGRAVGPKYYQASNGSYERCGERAKKAYPPMILSYRSKKPAPQGGSRLGLDCRRMSSHAPYCDGLSLSLATGGKKITVCSSQGSYLGAQWRFQSGMPTAA